MARHGKSSFCGPHPRHTFHDDARRFETGLLDYTAVYTLHAALGFLQQVGMPYISERVLALSGQVQDGLGRLEITPLTPRDPTQRAGIVSFESPHYQRIGEALHAAGVHVWYKEGRVRISPHFYNTERRRGGLSTRRWLQAVGR